jgi:hypothetical protein
MKRSLFMLLMCFALTTAGAAPWVVRPDGAGPLRIGMGFDEANQLLDGALRRTPAELRASEDCDQLPVPGRPGLWLMFISDRLARLDVGQPVATSWRGARVGDSVARLRKLHPRAAPSLHKYDERGRYYTELEPGGRFGVRFETDSTRVVMFYAGEVRAIQFVEGCN